MQYPAKVLLAWGEAISGHAALRNWLLENDYKELGLTCFALRHDQAARDWLMAEGFPHLMALVRGSEGEGQAVVWLERFGFEFLADVARGADNDDDAIHRLMQQGQREWAGIALKIRSIKNQIEADNNDIHKIART